MKAREGEAAPDPLPVPPPPPEVSAAPPVPVPVPPAPAPPDDAVVLVVEPGVVVDVLVPFPDCAAVASSSAAT